jgi:hypothetical protein
MHVLFIKDPPLDYLHQFLIQHCKYDFNKFTFDMATYQKLKYYHYDTDFCHHIDEYYHKYQKKYTNRPMDLKTFANLIRQICKYHNIRFETILQFYHSKHELVYHVYLDETREIITPIEQECD